MAMERFSAAVVRCAAVALSLGLATAEAQTPDRPANVKAGQPPPTAAQAPATPSPAQSAPAPAPAPASAEPPLPAQISIPDGPTALVRDPFAPPGPEPQQRTGRVAEGSPAIAHPFTLDGWTELTATMDGLSSDAELFVVDDTGRKLGFSTNGDTMSERVELLLDAGRYHAVAVPFDGTTNYRLGLSARAGAAPPPDLAGDTPETAYPLVLDDTGAAQVTDVIDSADGGDLFRVTVEGWTSLDVRLDGLASDADLAVIEEDGDTLGESARGGTEADDVTLRVPAGSYLIGVTAYGSRTPYTLTVTTRPTDAPPPDMAGNTPDAAHPLALDAEGGAQIDEFVGTEDDVDFYRVELEGFASLTARIDGLSADADLSVLDDVGTTLGDSAAGGTTPDEVTVSVPAGSYLIGVRAFGGRTSYTLTVSTRASEPQADETGDTPDTARAMPLVAGATVIIDEWLGPGDSADYFRLEAEVGGLLVVLLKPAAADLDLDLIDPAASGDPIATGRAGGTEEDRVLLPIVAGSYLLKVYSVGAPSGYQLRVVLVR